MIILSHRGYWKEVAEKNTAIAFDRSFDLGFGTETDVRDCGGKLVISHDMPNGNEMLFDDFLDMLKGRPLPLAINIKSDGLADLVKESIEKHRIANWFVFDMSMPDTRHHINIGNPVYARMSEVESENAWWDKVQGIWLDAFEGQWYKHDLITKLRQKGKRVCIVSPDLHKRPYHEFWQTLVPLRKDDGIMLCTDHPEKAKTLLG
jgi:glycerophosphoryl diester phosphodiesterase